MKIVIAGGSGLVGKALCDFFLDQGDEVIVLSRRLVKSYHKNLKYVVWLNPDQRPQKDLEGTDIIINLAGESINSGRWDERRKLRILQSRLTAVHEIISIIEGLEKKPQALINASAIGFYGTSETDTFTEENTISGNDFLATTVKTWESAALKAEQLGVRTVLCRFGIVLSKSGGALPKMALPYKLFAGGKLGKGSQWVSWIHIDDVLKAISFLIEDKKVNGPVNIISPNPVQMNEFGKTLADVLHRPHWIPTPGIALKLLLGEMSMLMLEGQRVVPEKLLKNGFKFKYPTLKSALQEIY